MGSSVTQNVIQKWKEIDSANDEDNEFRAEERPLDDVVRIDCDNIDDDEVC